MNKQEALEAILAECRRYEQPDGTEKPDGVVKSNDAFHQAVDRMKTAKSDSELQAACIQAGGALLFALLDEVG